MLMDVIPLERFEVIEILDKSKKGVHLLLKTDAGSKELWCPKKLLSINRYKENNRKITEAWIPSFITEKAGLT